MHIFSVYVIVGCICSLYIHIIYISYIYIIYTSIYNIYIYRIYVADLYTFMSCVNLWAWHLSDSSGNYWCIKVIACSCISADEGEYESALMTRSRETDTLETLASLRFLSLQKIWGLFSAISTSSTTLSWMEFTLHSRGLLWRFIT